MFEIVVDKKQCTGCGICVVNCPASVLELVDGKSKPVKAEDCLGCEVCMSSCDTEAITVSEI